MMCKSAKGLNAIDVPPAVVPPVPTASKATSSDEDCGSLPTIAHQVTHTVVMLWAPRAMLNAYPSLQQAIEDGSEATLHATASPVNKLNYEVCNELEHLQPDLFELLDMVILGGRCGKSNAQSGVKAEDNSKVKNTIVHWRKWSPSLVGEDKTIRGLSHPECACLLAPITVEWDDEEHGHIGTISHTPIATSHILGSTRN
ncbi:hypothetical protein RSAG8_12859, partial [Rhizoctonia solani AG-8 WAC10335]